MLEDRQVDTRRALKAVRVWRILRIRARTRPERPCATIPLQSQRALNMRSNLIICFILHQKKMASAASPTVNFTQCTLNVFEHRRHSPGTQSFPVYVSSRIYMMMYHSEQSHISGVSRIFVEVILGTEGFKWPASSPPGTPPCHDLYQPILSRHSVQTAPVLCQ